MACCTIAIEGRPIRSSDGALLSGLWILVFQMLEPRKAASGAQCSAIVQDTFGPFLYPDLNKAAAGRFLSGIGILALA